MNKMDYKHCCVVDAFGVYKTLVLVLLQKDESGETVENVQSYKLQPGERLIDANPPTMRQHAGAAGYIDPRWDDDAEAWVETATVKEIAAWEAEHPAPVEPEPEPEPGGELEERVAALEAAQASAWSEQAAAIREGVNSVE